MTSTLKDFLSTALGRTVSREEVAVALGYSVSTYRRRQLEGFPADDAIRAARHFDLSPVGALVACGFVSQDEVDSAAVSSSIAAFSDLDLAEEMLRRVVRPGGSGVLEAPLDEDHPAADAMSDHRASLRLVAKPGDARQEQEGE